MATTIAVPLQGQAYTTAFAALIAEMVSGKVAVEDATARLQNRTVITEKTYPNGTKHKAFIVDNDPKLMSMREVGRKYFRGKYKDPKQRVAAAPPPPPAAAQPVAAAAPEPMMHDAAAVAADEEPMMMMPAAAAPEPMMHDAAAAAADEEPMMMPAAASEPVAEPPPPPAAADQPTAVAAVPMMMMMMPAAPEPVADVPMMHDEALVPDAEPMMTARAYPAAPAEPPLMQLMNVASDFAGTVDAQIRILTAESARTKRLLEKSEQERKRFKGELAEIKSRYLRCMLCDDEFRTEERTVLRCGHFKTCKRCLQSHFDNAPKKGCLECEKPFTTSDLLNIGRLTDDVDRLESARLDNRIYECGMFPCCSSGCNALIRKDAAAHKRPNFMTNCGKCCAIVCTECYMGVSEHLNGRVSCQELRERHAERVFAELSNKTDGKICPNCMGRVRKGEEEGGDTATCDGCLARFCWRCGVVQVRATELLTEDDETKSAIAQSHYLTAEALEERFVDRPDLLAFARGRRCAAAGGGYRCPSKEAIYDKLYYCGF